MRLAISVAIVLVGSLGLAACSQTPTDGEDLEIEDSGPTPVATFPLLEETVTITQDRPQEIAVDIDLQVVRDLVAQADATAMLVIRERTLTTNSSSVSIKFRRTDVSGISVELAELFMYDDPAMAEPGEVLVSGETLGHYFIDATPLLEFADAPAEWVLELSTIDVLAQSESAEPLRLGSISLDVITNLD